MRALSGGQARRVEIARALLHDPACLLLDEATVGLDVASRESVLAIVRGLVRERGVGVLWATHLVDEVAADDRVVLLHKGRVRFAGPVPDLLEAARPARCAARSCASPKTRSPRPHDRLRRITAPRCLAGYVACFSGIVWREVLRFLHQRERFLAALVRPLVWLFIFAAGFRQVLGVSIIPPYQTYVLYEVFVTPGLVAMVLLFNAMQTSLSMVYDRETGAMRTLLVSPFPRSFLLVSKLLGGVAVALLQAYAFLLIAYFWEVEPPLIGYARGAAGARAVRADAGRARALHVVGDPAAGELRRRHELRDLPDVLRLLGALPALAHQGVEPAALRDLPRQPLHLRRRADPLRALRPARADIAGRRARLHRVRSWRRRSSPTTPRRACSPGAAKPAEDGDMAPSMPDLVMIVASMAVLRSARRRGAEAVNPDWPCVQHKIATLTSAQMWDGPPVDDLTAWRDNAEIGKLIPTLASRRVPIEQAAAAIAQFAEAQPQGEARRRTQAAVRRPAQHRQRRPRRRDERHRALPAAAEGARGGDRAARARRSGSSRRRRRATRRRAPSWPPPRSATTGTCASSPSVTGRYRPIERQHDKPALEAAVEATCEPRQHVRGEQVERARREGDSGLVDIAAGYRVARHGSLQSLARDSRAGKLVRNIGRFASKANDAMLIFHSTGRDTRYRSCWQKQWQQPGDGRLAVVCRFAEENESLRLG